MCTSNRQWKQEGKPTAYHTLLQMTSKHSGTCFGGEDCPCAIGKIGQACVLTIFVPLLILILAVCFCVAGYYCLKARHEKEKSEYERLVENNNTHQYERGGRGGQGGGKNYS